MAKKRVRSTAREDAAPVKVSSKYASAVEKARKAPIGAPVWRPTKVDEAIAGKILSHTWRDGSDRPYCSVFIDTGSASTMVRLGTILVREFHDQGIRVGAEVAIAYKGEAPSGRGHPAKVFSLVVVKEGTGDVIVDSEAFKSLEHKRERLKARRKVARKGKKR